MPVLLALGAAFLVCLQDACSGLYHVCLVAATEASICCSCGGTRQTMQSGSNIALIGGHFWCCRINRSDYPAQAGGYAGWTTPYSYNTVRTLQQDIGLLRNGSCLRSNEIEDLITCAAGQIKLPLDQLRMQCAREGLHCPEVTQPPACTACSACPWDSQKNPAMMWPLDEHAQIITGVNCGSPLSIARFGCQHGCTSRSYRNAQDRLLRRDKTYYTCPAHHEPECMEAFIFTIHSIWKS